jgi:hypothetical protein
MNRNLVFELATANWVGKREDALFLCPVPRQNSGLPSNQADGKHQQF